jgi:hypothetical protein
MKDAVCANSNVDPNWWTGEVYSRDRDRPEKTHIMRVVKNFCAECPVRRECLLTCLRFEQADAQEQVGIWGGTTVAERRGKTPDQVDELLIKMTEQINEEREWWERNRWRIVKEAV